MISKELLSEVLGFGVYQSIRKDEYAYNDIKLNIINTELLYDYVNIYELAHKCKEWANYYGFFLYPARAFEYTFVQYGCAIMKPKYNAGSFAGLFGVDRYDERDYLAETEVEAIIKASEWILKEIKK